MKSMKRVAVRRGAGAIWDAAAFAGLALAIVTGFSAGAMF